MVGELKHWEAEKDSGQNKGTTHKLEVNNLEIYSYLFIYLWSNSRSNIEMHVHDVM